MKLVVSLCLSHLGYSNCIFHGLPNSTKQQMQNIHNYGAVLVIGRRKYDSNKKALAELHWLPVKSRIKFKILVLVFKFLREEAPDYLMNLLVRCTESTHNLRSKNIKDRLVTLRTIRQTFASISSVWKDPHSGIDYLTV